MEHHEYLHLTLFLTKLVPFVDMERGVMGSGEGQPGKHVT